MSYTLLPFADPDNPESCRLAVILNPYSPLYREVGYSVQDLHRGFLDAFHSARADGLALPDCKCGQCPV